MDLATRTLLALTTLGAWAIPSDCLAEQQGPTSADEPLVLDFEQGDLAGWSVALADERSTKAVKIMAVDGGKAYQLTGRAIPGLEGKPNESRVQIEEVDGDGALHVQGPVTRIEKHELTFYNKQEKIHEDTLHRHVVKAVLPGFNTDTFVMQFDIKGTGGIEFGGGYRVFVRRVGDVGKLMWKTPLGRPDELSLRFMTLGKWNTLKVVCTPSFMRVYREDMLVGDIVLNARQSWPRGVQKAPVALCGEDVYFDDVEVSRSPAPLDACIVAPATPADVEPPAYAFPAGRAVTVSFDVLNYGSSEVQFGLAVNEFSKASERQMGAKPVAAGSGDPQRVTFELGPMDPGFHQMHLTFSHGGKTFGSQIWPLAVLRSMGGRKEDFVRPVLPVGPYLATMRYCRTREPFYGNTFIRKILDDLKYYGFTAFVECGRSFSEANLDLCAKYGIAVWDRGIPRDHPVVIGGLIGDEPSYDELDKYRKEYEAARAVRREDQYMLTNVVMDRALSCRNNFFWDALKPRFRFCRIYSCSGATTTRDNLRLIGKTITYPGQLTNVRSYGNTPYGMIIPTFGEGGPKAYYRDPTAAEAKVMTHMSLAYGAKGLFYYTWQSESVGDGGALVDPMGLRPLDGKLMGLTGEAFKVRDHARLIHSLQPDPRRVYCSTPWVEIVPLRSGNDKYLYVINRNVRSVTRADVYWDPERRIRNVREVFGDQAVRVFQAPFGGDESSSRVRVDLLPGEGQLLEVRTEAR